MGQFNVRASAPGEFGQLNLMSAAVPFGSATGGTVDLGALEVGDVVVMAWAQVTQAFNGTTPEVVLGDGTTANKYLAAGDVTEGTLGVYPTNGKGPFAAETAAGTLRATVTGTGMSAGSARIYAMVNKVPA